MSSQTNTQTTADRELLGQAFLQLRRRGIRARANFQCCVTCAINAFGDGQRFVYWTRQDDRAFDDLGHLAPKGIYLGRGNVDAAEVVRILREAGVAATWDGDEGHRILVLPARQAA